MIYKDDDVLRPRAAVPVKAPAKVREKSVKSRPQVVRSSEKSCEKVEKFKKLILILGFRGSSLFKTLPYALLIIWDLVKPGEVNGKV